MKLTNLSQKIGLQETDLKNHLKLLLNSSLIELQNFGKEAIFYAATEKGMSILNIYNRIIKDEQKIRRHEHNPISVML
jgi:hypothetical protein